MSDMVIPYSVENHPVTGVNNGKLAIWLFLASEVMLFGALFSAFILLRVGADPPTWELWKAHSAALHDAIPLAFVNTLVLITSSVTMVMSWANFKMKNPAKGKTFLWITFACACIFLVIKYVEYSGKFSHGLYPKSSTFLATYFTLTGLHGLHVVGGMVVMFYLGTFGSKMLQTDPDKYHGRIECTGLYWHFVDLVWIFLFPSLYLLPVR